jgi:hypothetical protein
MASLFLSAFALSADLRVLEHGITTEGAYAGENDLQQERLDVYFNSVSNGRYIPRAVCVDLEPGVLDSVRNVSVVKCVKQSTASIDFNVFSDSLRKSVSSR